MIKEYIGKLKNSSFAKKYIEPIITDILEESFDFDRRIIGGFTDSFGNRSELYAGLRSKIKPGWQSMFDPDSSSKIPTQKDLKLNLIEAKRHVANFERLLNSFNININKKSLLEIGCFNGIKTFLLGCGNYSSVTGSDVSFYYEDLAEKSSSSSVKNRLNNLRDTVIKLFSENEQKSIKNKVSFVEDDISKSVIADNSFDIIASWETLEHIGNIDNAFKNIRRILKPNGIAFHEYNPFFSLNGGHSFCTLDFPWGHCRLNEKDFTRYLNEFRPKEYTAASGFYQNSLNRMSMEDLKDASKKAGLEILALIPFVKKAHLTLYNNIYYKQTSQIYSSVQPMDLISPVVWVVHKKNN
jgi:SAM-dependent methyltransferase